MIAQNTVILDLDDYNTFAEVYKLVEEFNDNVEFYDENKEKSYNENNCSYIEIDRKALMKLLETNISDIRIIN